MLYPLTFQPIFKERVWGGRELARLYRKPLPAGRRIGESWEISDRPGDAGVIANGPLAGKNLRWLMEHHRKELLGRAKPAAQNRFPLLCKILDAREKLSLQVHPPAHRAAKLGGEPKTELWFIAGAAQGAELYVGVKPGVTRARFRKKISDGTVTECIHRLRVRSGDAIFLPSGEVHAIGAGLVIFEIQQNSDTTYRVFDWNRVGLDGKPRELHVAQSLSSIHFSGRKPMVWRNKRRLLRHSVFDVDYFEMKSGVRRRLRPKTLQIVAVIRGRLEIRGGSASARLSAGQFCLVPASLEDTEIAADAPAAWLRVEAG